MNNYNEVKKRIIWYTSREFASYHMSKAEYTDYLIRKYSGKGQIEHALEVLLEPV